MINPTLLPDETILRHGTITKYGAASTSRWLLYLTDQRLIFKNLLLGEQGYPLARVVRVSQRRALLFNGVSVEYDNGGEHFFTVWEPTAWAQAIEQARAKAPRLAEAPLPPPAAAPALMTWLVVSVVVGLFSLLGCAGLVAMLLLLSLSR